MASSENSKTALRILFGRLLSIVFPVRDLFACSDLNFIYCLSAVKFMRCTLRKVNVRNKLLSHLIYVFDDFVWLMNLARLTEVARLERILCLFILF